ncbi:MAG TPA: M23 family metallopeptidase [Micromonosporaceae bacterium]|nr:M23 family metallopeptidase [Micromonosporaceae bacterium]
MQESTSTDNHPGGRAREADSRSRLSARLTGRGRYISCGAAAFLGVSLATGALLAGDGPWSTTAAQAGQGTAAAERAGLAGLAQQDEQAERAALAERAGRSTRTTPGPLAPAPSTMPSDATKPKVTTSRAPAPVPPKPRPAPAWTHPMPGADVTSCYGMRWGSMHQGVDLSMPYGTPIRAVGTGTVVSSGWNGGYGISVVVDHGNGYLSHYAHMSDAAVGQGRRVGPGQVLGYEGSTGSSTGPHLHFEVHRGLWNAIEPVRWLRARGVDIGGC